MSLSTRTVMNMRQWVMRSRVNLKHDDLEDSRAMTTSAGKPVQRSWRKLAVFAVGAVLLTIALCGITGPMTGCRRRMPQSIMPPNGRCTHCRDRDAGKKTAKTTSSNGLNCDRCKAYGWKPELYGADLLFLKFLTICEENHKQNYATEELFKQYDGKIGTLLEIVGYFEEVVEEMNILKDTVGSKLSLDPKEPKTSLKKLFQSRFITVLGRTQTDINFMDISWGEAQIKRLSLMTIERAIVDLKKTEMFSDFKSYFEFEVVCEQFFQRGRDYTPKPKTLVYFKKDNVIHIRDKNQDPSDIGHCNGDFDCDEVNELCRQAGVPEVFGICNVCEGRWVGGPKKVQFRVKITDKIDNERYEFDDSQVTCQEFRTVFLHVHGIENPDKYDLCFEAKPNRWGVGRLSHSVGLEERRFRGTDFGLTMYTTFYQDVWPEEDRSGANEFIMVPERPYKYFAQERHGRRLVDGYCLAWMLDFGMGNMVHDMQAYAKHGEYRKCMDAGVPKEFGICNVCDGTWVSGKIDEKRKMSKLETTELWNKDRFA